MPDPRLYESETYVLLEPNQEEQFLSSTELLEKLTAVLADRQHDLPRELQAFPSVPEQAQHLMETACELDTAPGESWQWFAVRLEK
jgi:hypothetical protein